MDKYISDLLELIKAHPELPIVPMVDSEIVCDDGCARWMGAWGPASVTKYLVSEEHIFFFDDEDVEAVLIEVKGYDEFLSMTDKEAGKPITPSPGWSASPWTSTRHELLRVRLRSLSLQCRAGGVVHNAGRGPERRGHLLLLR